MHLIGICFQAVLSPNMRLDYAPLDNSELKAITKSLCNSCVIVPRKPENFTEFLNYYLKLCNIHIQSKSISYLKQVRI
jgi:hypothetical protein